MARFARARGYASRGRSYAGRGYRAANKSYGGKMGMNLSPAFLAGVVAGFTDLDDKIPGQLVLGVATAPIKGIGMAKAAAQGVIFGNLLQQLKNKQISTGGYQGMVTI